MNKQNLTRIFLMGISFWLISCATQDTKALYGKWTNIDATFYFSDGTNSKSPAHCSVEFLESKFISECPGKEGKDRTVYHYQLVSPGKYDVELVENRNPKIIGVRVKSELHVEQNKLFVISYPQAKAEQNPKAVVKVESIYIRE